MSIWISKELAKKLELGGDYQVLGKELNYGSGFEKQDDGWYIYNCCSEYGSIKFREDGDFVLSGDSPATVVINERMFLRMLNLYNEYLLDKAKEQQKTDKANMSGC